MMMIGVKIALLMAPVVSVANGFIIECEDGDVPKFSIQMHHIQDMSASYSGILGTLQSVMPQLVDELQDNFETVGLSLGSFVDKPVDDFGIDGDYCYKMHVPMTDSKSEFTTALNSLSVYKGNDMPESQLDSLMAAALSSSIGWSTSGVDEHGLPIIKLIVVATDADSHEAGDGAEYSLYPNDGDGNIDCENEDYASRSQVSAALKTNNIIPAFIVSGSTPLNYYNEVLDDFTEDGVNGVVTEIEDWKDIVEKIMESLEEIVCRTTTSTTTTTTTVTTTKTSTTTTTLTSTSTTTKTATTTLTSTTTTTVTTTTKTSTTTEMSTTTTTTAETSTPQTTAVPTSDATTSTEAPVAGGGGSSTGVIVGAAVGGVAAAGAVGAAAYGVVRHMGSASSPPVPETQEDTAADTIDAADSDVAVESDVTVDMDAEFFK